MRPYLTQVRGLLAIGSLAGAVMNTAVVLPALLLGRAIDTLVAFDAGQATAKSLTGALLLFVGGTLATELPRVGKRYWLGVARSRIRATLRADALRGVLSWPAARLRQTPVGEVVARVIGDVEVVGTGIGEVIVETWDTLLFSASLAVAMLALDPTLAALALAPVPIAMVLAKVVGARVADRTVTARAANGALTAHISERLAAVRLLKVSGRSAQATAELRRLAWAQAVAELASIRLAAGLQPIYGLLTVAGALAAIWLGGHRVAAGAMSVGALVAFLQLFTRFAGRAWRIPQMANRVQSGAAAFARLRPLLASPVTGQDLSRRSAWRANEIPAPRTEEPRTGARRDAGRKPGGVALRVDAVSFTYPGATTPALDNIDVTVAAGSLLAITGPIGSGKTALANLLAGLVEPDAGRVFIDGTDPTAWSADERATLGYLSQGHPLFTGSIVDNLLFFADRPDQAARLAAAIRLACLGPDLAALADGAQTQVGEGGVRLSGGQRQRVALARALAAPDRPPRLLVLDDPFSAVDVATEAAIVAELRAQTGPRAPIDHQATVVLCSSRLASFRHADHIVVLDQGRLCEQGTHQALLSAGGPYARIYHAQRQASDQAPTVPP